MSGRTLIADRDFGMNVALAGLKQRGYAPDVVFDIGAADGQWARNVLGMWAGCRVICFEPLPQRAAALEKVQTEYPGRVEVLACGIGDADEIMSIGITDSLYDSSFAYAGKQSLSVQVHTLDNLLAQGRIPEASFIKVDVQGFERRVIDGGKKLIRHADLILLECQFFPFCPDMRTLDETIGHMASHGFVPYEFVDFLRRPLDGAMGQCDILFVRRGHKLVSDLRWSE